MNINPKNIDVQGDYCKVLDAFYMYAGDKEDRYVQSSFKNIGLWDIHLTNFMIQNIKPGWKCLDVGANTGYFTEVMARLSGPTGYVMAFEPIKKLVDAYEEGKKLNDYSNSAPITMHNFGLSSESKDAYVRVTKENVGGSHINESPESGSYEGGFDYIAEPTKLKALSDIYDEVPDFIKMDIEGHERFAFEGFSENTLKCPLIVIELGQGHPVSFLNYLNRNYDMTYVNGLKAETYDIIGYDVVNVVMRKKQ